MGTTGSVINELEIGPIAILLTRIPDSNVIYTVLSGVGGCVCVCGKSLCLKSLFIVVLLPLSPFLHPFTCSSPIVCVSMALLSSYNSSFCCLTSCDTHFRHPLYPPPPLIFLLPFRWLQIIMLLLVVVYGSDDDKEWVVAWVLRMNCIISHLLVIQVVRGK